MSEHPILFKGPLVRAILEGRKSVTRRPVKDEIDGPRTTVTISGSTGKAATTAKRGGFWKVPCPYGQPGDRLWVKETFFQVYDADTCRPVEPPRYLYRATHEGEVVQFNEDGGTKINKDGSFASPWRPSIYMPRQASRLTLEITSVQIERLHDITEEQARAEGVHEAMPAEGRAYDIALKEWCRWSSRLDPGARQGSARGLFAMLWERIHGSGTWDANPWVWVISFKREGQP